MGFNFNFNGISGVAKSRRLRPWGIYDVKFVDAKVDEIQGKKDPTQKYKILKIRFEDKDQSYYEENIFYPEEGEDVRREYENASGGTTVLPSIFDNKMRLIANIGEVLNPDGYKKMQGVNFKSFDEVCKALIKILESAKGKETKIKLTGINRNGRIEPTSPRVAGIKDGELFTVDNFIGPNVAFSSYELNRKEEMEKAAPTLVAASKVDNKAKESNNFDFDDILG